MSNLLVMLACHDANGPVAVRHRLTWEAAEYLADRTGAHAVRCAGAGDLWVKAPDLARGKQGENLVLLIEDQGTFLLIDTQMMAARAVARIEGGVCTVEDFRRREVLGTVRTESGNPARGVGVHVGGCALSSSTADQQGNLRVTVVDGVDCILGAKQGILWPRSGRTEATTGFELVLRTVSDMPSVNTRPTEMLVQACLGLPPSPPALAVDIAAICDAASRDLGYLRDAGAIP